MNSRQHSLSTDSYYKTTVVGTISAWGFLVLVLAMSLSATSNLTFEFMNQRNESQNPIFTTQSLKHIRF